MKRKILNLLKGTLFLLFWTFSLCTFAQNVTITGIVTDTEGESLVGVTLLVQGSNQGTVTDINGRFTLSNVPSNGTLEVTYVGMQRQVVPING
ncbi:MAG: TonB-linked outer membrane protein, SusC/RagA family, partial [Bacteroidetes bacterium 38_7]